MDPENQLKLSFYKEITNIGDSQKVRLVKKIDTDEIYVKKEYDSCDTRVFDILKESGFSGIPEIIECIHDPDSSQTTIIEEHINGKTLRTLLDINGTIPDDEIINISLSICNILMPLHNHIPPVIHRDIKPENVIIRDGKVYLVDFDASKLYTEGHHRDTELLGTASYAAPEQYGFLQSDPRTDIYALGVLMREMSTGSPEASNNNLSPLNSIITKCTHIDPDDRFQNVYELKLALLEKQPPEISYNYVSEEIDTSSYALPGFRGNNTGVKVMAGFLYFLAAYLSFTYKEDGLSTAALWANRVLIFIVIMALTLFFGNYQGILTVLPVTRSSNKAVRILGYILYTFIVIFILGFFALLIDKYL